ASVPRHTGRSRRVQVRSIHGRLMPTRSPSLSRASGYWVGCDAALPSFPFLTVGRCAQRPKRLTLRDPTRKPLLGLRARLVLYSNSLLTDSLKCIRLIASASTVAPLTVLRFGNCFCGGRGMLSVSPCSLFGASLNFWIAGPTSSPCVAQA